MKDYLEFGRLMGETAMETQAQLALNNQTDVVLDDRAKAYLKKLQEEEDPYTTLAAKFEALAMNSETNRVSPRLAKNRNRVTYEAEPLPVDPKKAKQGPPVVGPRPSLLMVRDPIISTFHRA